MSAEAAIISIILAGLIFWLVIKYDLCASAAERKFNAEYPARTPLSDEDITREYFADEVIDPEIVAKVRRIFAECLCLDAQRVLPDDDFLAMDSSLDLTEIVMEVEEAFGFELTSSELSSADASVRGVSRLVQRKLDGATSL